ncbi:MAG: hypothetical protein ACYDCN_12590 [Bacteroidia bacterium]
MIKKLIILLGIIVSINVIAQETVKVELNCYNKWAQKFDERGAEDVADGTYTDVIITFRTGANAECFQGKAIVKDHKIDMFYIMLDDGSYDQVQRVWKNDVKDVTISNGISKTLITKDNQLINIIWPKKIKPKKAGFKKAADPTDD